VIEIISDLEKKGILKKLIQAGFISTKLLLYYEVYLDFDAYKKTGKGNTEIIILICDKFNISEQTVYRILRLFSDENRCIDSNKGRPRKVS